MEPETRTVKLPVDVKDYDPACLRLDMDQYFWCERYQTNVCFSQCIFRYHSRNRLDFPQCHKCKIRKATFRKLRVPRVVVRFPRDEEGNVTMVIVRQGDADN